MCFLQHTLLSVGVGGVGGAGGILERLGVSDLLAAIHVFLTTLLLPANFTGQEKRSSNAKKQRNSIDIFNLVNSILVYPKIIKLHTTHF